VSISRSASSTLMNDRCLSVAVTLMVCPFVVVVLIYQVLAT
jgi:hypothetical protein